MTYPVDFVSDHEARYIPKRSTEPFTAKALCDMSKGGVVIKREDMVPVTEIIVQTDADGWQRVGYTISKRGRKVAFPATKFTVGPKCECPNYEVGTYMVDWWYDEENPYTPIKRKRN